VSRTGIVLAGGRSTRFGSDKLAAPLGDGTVLGATIEAVSALVDGVIVAGSALPGSFEAGKVPTAFIPDPDPFPGPLAALANVLATAGTPDPEGLAIVVGGDMPRIVPAVLIAMVEALEGDATAGAVVLGAAEGATTSSSSEPPRRQVLPLAIRIQPASRAAREAVEAGQRSLQALLARMTVIELGSSAWLALDPAALTLADVDTPADLDRLRRR
jgi:molybdopterin-guanine dinucleotide biosynthesis protein A